MVDLVRRDVDAPAVYLKVTVADDLPGVRARQRQPHAVDDVVEAPFERDEQRFAGNARALRRFLEVLAELALEHAVDALDLLLLAQLNVVVGRSATATTTVFTGGVVAALDGALVGQATGALQRRAWCPHDGKVYILDQCSEPLLPPLPVLRPGGAWAPGIHCGGSASRHGWR